MPDLMRSVAQSLKFVLVDASDFKTPVTTHTNASLSCKYVKAGGTSLTTKTLSSGNTRHVGDGIYEIDFTAAELDTLGFFVSKVVNASGTAVLPYYREDRVVSASVAGVTGRSITLHTQTAGAVPIPTVDLQIRDSGGNAVLAQAQTDSGGNAVFLLPDGTYKVYAWKAGYTWTNPTTLVVTADGTTNLTGAAFAPSNPGGPTLTTVYGWLLDSGGAVRAGITVAFQPALEGGAVRRPFGISSVTKLLSRYSRSVVTDANGYFEVQLTPNDIVTPLGTVYAVTFSDTPNDRAAVSVPSAGPVNFYSLLT